MCMRTHGYQMSLYDVNEDVQDCHDFIHKIRIFYVLELWRWGWRSPKAIDKIRLTLPKDQFSLISLPRRFFFGEESQFITSNYRIVNKHPLHLRKSLPGAVLLVLHQESLSSPPLEHPFHQLRGPLCARTKLTIDDLSLTYPVCINLHSLIC
jgi:hypothetical protein